MSFPACSAFGRACELLSLETAQHELRVARAMGKMILELMISVPSIVRKIVRNLCRFHFTEHRERFSVWGGLKKGRVPELNNSFRT